MNHMAGAGDHAFGQSPETRLARGEILRRELQKLGRLRLGAHNPEHGRCDLAPARLGFLEPIEKRVDELVYGIACELDAAVGLRPSPVPREERGLLDAQAGIVAAQALGERFEVFVVAKRRLFAQLGQPARVALGRLLRSRPGEPKTFQVDELRHALGANAGVHRGDIAAHAVADEHGRRIRLKVLEQSIQIGKIIREPVAVALRPFAQAEAAPVRRDHAPVAAQRVHQELERGRHVHPAVQHEQLSRALAAPAAAVITQPAHGHEYGFTRLHGSA